MATTWSRRRVGDVCLPEFLLSLMGLSIMVLMNLSIFVLMSLSILVISILSISVHALVRTLFRPLPRQCCLLADRDEENQPSLSHAWENLFANCLDAHSARSLAEKMHVGACAILMSLCKLMFLMSLMFLYIRVLPHILNIPWQTQFSYVIKSLTSKSVFLRALCIQVLCVLTFSSSMHFVALAFCPGPWHCVCFLLCQQGMWPIMRSYKAFWSYMTIYNLSHVLRSLMTYDVSDISHEPYGSL